MLRRLYVRVELRSLRALLLRGHARLHHTDRLPGLGSRACDLRFGLRVGPAHSEMVYTLHSLSLAGLARARTFCLY